jgi:hypothetical protein
VLLLEAQSSVSQGPAKIVPDNHNLSALFRESLAIV